MTINIQNTSTTNTFDFWRNRTNELAEAMSTYAVTTESNTAVGNAAITGTFTANNLVVNNGITIGGTNANGSGIGVGTINANVISSNSLNTLLISVGDSSVNAVINSSSYSLANSTVSFSLKLPTSAQQSAQTFFLNANGSWGSLNNPITNTSFNSAGVGPQVVDSYVMSSYNAATYFINVTDLVSNNYYTTNITTTHDGSSAYITEYAAITTNTSVGVFSAATNATHVQLVFTPTSSSTLVKYARTLI